MQSSPWFTLLKQIKDPRVERTRYHLLEDIVLLTLIGTMAGAEGFTNIEDYGRINIVWLKDYLQLPNGIPSHDTIGRVFGGFDASEFEQFFISWTASLTKHTEGNLISIDGKTLRGSHSRYKGKESIHLVNAWSESNGLVLGQMLSEGKKNEIKTIPKLLDLLQLKGSVITTDAMGCQKDIVEKIVKKEADYILSVKDNQPTLFTEVKTAFAVTKPSSEHRTTSKEHGRIETRQCTVISNLKWVEQAKKWKGLKTIIQIQAHRHEISTGKTTTHERFYISSVEKKSAEYFNQAIRKHWAIENKLHYVLDVTFCEDLCRVREGNADRNLSTVRKMAMNLFKLDTESKKSIKARRNIAGWNKEYLIKVLKI